ncbi:hypothetical protein ACFXTN_015473 [Malus domestica]
MDSQVEEENPSSSPATGRGDGGGGGEEEEWRCCLVISKTEQELASFPLSLASTNWLLPFPISESQIDIIQKELDHLETVGESSIVCKDLIATVESTSDPLLPWTKGPGEVGWDRWFRGAHNTKNQSRWI